MIMRIEYPLIYFKIYLQVYREYNDLYKNIKNMDNKLLYPNKRFTSDKDKDKDNYNLIKNNEINEKKIKCLNI